jgi:hypothetical protein
MVRHAIYIYRLLHFGSALSACQNGEGRLPIVWDTLNVDSPYNLKATQPIGIKTLPIDYVDKVFGWVEISIGSAVVPTHISEM